MSSHPFISLRKRRCRQMELEIMMSGVGGQGLQVSGLLLGTAAMLEGKHVLQFSAYIGAMRGLNSETTTIISDSRIEQPPLLGQWSALVALDMQPFEEYRDKVKPGGVIVVNRAQIPPGTARSDLAVLPVPATELAQELGNQMVVSMVALGAFAEATGVVALKSLLSGLEEALPLHRRQHMLVNERALRKGSDFMRELRTATGWEPGPLFAAINS